MIHSFTVITSEFKGANRIVAGTTGCGETFKTTIHRDHTLAAAGLSAWYSDITCATCKTRTKPGAP